MNFKIRVKEIGKEYYTLKDILPEDGRKLKILFIAKTPATKSVEIGHYFQGRQGQMFWNILTSNKILICRPETFHDENLIEQGYGITDIVKSPRDYGNEPSPSEYEEGFSRIMDIIRSHKPQILVFVYKKVLDKVLEIGYKINCKTEYGFNPILEDLFNAKVFVFPMPGTPCRKEIADRAIDDLLANLKFHDYGQR